MGDSLTTCTANLTTRLTALVAAFTAPLVALPVFKDANIETGQDPPSTGYIQTYGLVVINEVQESRGGPIARYEATWRWALTVCIPRGTGEGMATDIASAICDAYRGLVLGDLWVTTISQEPLEKQPEDAFYQVEVRMLGDKISEYTIAT